MNIFILLFFGLLFVGFYNDIKITEKKQNNPKYKSGDTVFHIVSGYTFEIIKQATQNDLLRHYPIFSNRPYSGYWVKIIQSGVGVFNIRYSEDITLQPISESVLIRKEK